MLDTLSNLHRMYTRDCVDDMETISLTKFISLRPKECVFPTDSSAHNSCLCIYHENMNLAIDCMISSKIFQNVCNNDLLTLLKNRLLCENKTDDCYLRECENCKNNSLEPFLIDIFDKASILTIKRKCWIVSKRTDLMDVEEEIDSFIENFDTNLKKFLTHEFKLIKQQSFIKSAKASLTANSILLQIDFAENYACFTQNAVQSDFFTAVQVTIHPCAIYYSEGNTLNLFKIVIVSNVVKHTTASVYAIQKKIVPVLKQKFEKLQKIIYVSDGAGSQYKNVKNFKNLCLHKQDFDIEAEWHFTVTSHGKSACDGIGGAVKRTARCDTLRGASIKNAKEFFDWATNRFKEMLFIFVDENDIESATIEIQNRGDFKSLPGTQRYHQFLPQTEDDIEVAPFSGSSATEKRKLVSKKKNSD